MPSRGMLINRFGLVCLKFLIKVRREHTMQGFEVATAKNRERVVLLGFSGWVIEWCLGRHIEGYLNGFMDRFVYMVYVH